MELGGLIRLIETLRERAKTFNSELQNSEALTRYALVDPVLRALGWATDDPSQVRVELPAGAGKVDYCLFDSSGKPRVLIEAKKLNSPKVAVATGAAVTYAFQLLSQLGSNSPLLVGVTDGLRWELYEIPHLKEPSSAFSLADGSPAEAALALLATLWQPLSCKAPLPGLPPEPSGPPAPTPSTGRISLDRLRVASRGRPPQKLLLPDGKDRPLRAWKDLLGEVANYLVDIGKLTPDRCPVRPRQDSSRYLVAEQRRHPSGREFFQPVRLTNGLWVETHYSAKDIVHYSNFLLRYLGEDPARYSVVINQ